MSEKISILNNEVKNARKKYREAIKWFNGKQAEVDKIVGATREAAASTGVTTFTKEFADEASNLQTKSTYWLIATALLVATTIGASILLIYWPTESSGANEWETIRNLVSKAAIIAVLFTSTIWCGRIYRSFVHQVSVNRHRALSLKTFQAFTEATSDPYVKDAVLMAATKSVFTSVPTGLVEQVENQEQGVNFVKFGKSSGEKLADTLTEKEL